MPRSLLRRWLRPATGALVALVFVWLVARRVEWAELRRTLAAVALGPVALGGACFAAGLGVRVIRWWWMLRPFEPGLQLGRCFRPFVVSLALNNTVPFRAGDVARAFGFRGALRSPPSRVLGTLVVERLLDLLVLLTVLTVGLAGIAGLGGALQLAGVAGAAARRELAVMGAVLAGLGIAVASLCALAPGPIARALVRLEARWAARPRLARLVAATGEFAAALGVLRSPSRAAQLVGLSVVAWLLEGAMYVSAAHALHLAVPAAAPWLALATGTLATLLPGSPGYVGTYDYFAMLGLTAYGVSATGAAAFAVLVHLLLWLPVTLAGGALLFTPATLPARRGAEPA